MKPANPPAVAPIAAPTAALFLEMGNFMCGTISVSLLTHGNAEQRNRSSRHQYDPNSVHGRRPTGGIRTPWYPDGARTARVCALHARDASRPRGSQLAESRSLRPLGG